MILGPNLDEVTTADLQALVDEGVRERRTIDYKLTLPGRTDGDKHRFLADICSFANAAGGELIYGIEEANGQPVKIQGLANFSPDDDMLRLESIIRTGISPRVPGIQFHAVPDFANRPALVVRVPRSWAGPHMVSFNDSSRFYSRSTSAGNFQMDYEQIRSAFEGAAGLVERMRQWRDERVTRIIEGKPPVRCQEGPKLVLHVIPFDAFAEPMRYAVRELRGLSDLHPLGDRSHNPVVNVDGLLTQTAHRGGGVEAYCQTWRSGKIEAMNSDVVVQEQEHRLIRLVWCEQILVDSLRSYLAAYKQIGAQPPIAVLVSLVGVYGVRLPNDRMAFINADPRPADRDSFFFPEVLIEEEDCDLPVVLRPVFDSMWNAFGVSMSLTYDDEGIWNTNRTY